jgi:hypothetical protein
MTIVTSPGKVRQNKGLSGKSTVTKPRPNRDHDRDQAQEHRENDATDATSAKARP